MYETPFMLFWKDVNEVLAKHKLPEMCYGDAKDLFAVKYKTPDQYIKYCETGSAL